MKSQNDLHSHHYADELLEDYALGTLSADDMVWMRTHLKSCLSCLESLAPLMAATQALAFAVSNANVQMSDDLWDRIEQSISKSDATAPAVAPSQSATATTPSSNIRSLPPPRLMQRQWLTVAALMVLSLIGGTLLDQVLPQFNNDEVEGQQIAIQFTDPGITATGELRYLPEQHVFVLDVEGLEPPPEGFVHQAWLIDENVPVPVGVMNSELGEFASVGNRDAFQTFAITIEPGPLGNEAPTTEPILVAPLHEEQQS